MSTKEGSGPASPKVPVAAPVFLADAPAPTAEEHLSRAMAARSPEAREREAKRGLAHPEPLDDTTHAMLLRQCYVASFERGEFERAASFGEQALRFDVLVDVIHQDVARACQARGDIDGAVTHLRAAARRAPASRRAFHHWTLGSVLFLAGRHEDAIASLQRAARWGTADKPLYQGHLALAKCGAGYRVRDLGGLIDRLASCPAGQGYGRFVLGQLAYQHRRWDDAREHLQSFVARTRAGQPAMKVAMAGELAMAEATLAALEAAS
ncbi:MAG: tetratricopeptide repeat protein [Myxococcota bacterium]